MKPYAGAGTLPNAVSDASARLVHNASCDGRYTDEDVLRQSFDGLRRELGRGQLTSVETVFVLEAMLSDALLLPGLSSHAEMDAWSRRLMDVGGGIATIQGTRGAILAELGLHSEAKALLSGKTINVADEPVDALLTVVFLSKAEAGLGNSGVACWLMLSAIEIARPLDGQLVWAKFLERARAQVSERPTS